MRAIRVLFAFLILLSPKAVFAQSATGPDSAAVHTQIVALNRGMEQAFREGNLRKVAAAYADNAIIRSSRGIGAKGRKDIDSYFGGVPNPKSITVEMYGLSIQGDIAYQTVLLKNVFGSPERSNVFQAMLVWQRQRDGQFRIVMQYYHEVEKQ